MQINYWGGDRMKSTLLIIFILLSVLIGFAFGQSGLCYKDLCIGMDEKEATSFLDGTHESYKLSKEKEKEIFDDCNRLFTSNNVPGCIEKETLQVKLEKYDKIGEISVKKPKLEFLDRKLASIVVLITKSSDYKELRNALIEKWGQPTDTSQKEYQNRMGAKFHEIIDTWTKPDGIISYWISPSSRGNDIVAYTIRSKEFVIKELNESKQRKSGVTKGL
jgi:hypothetical protein